MNGYIWMVIVAVYITKAAPLLAPFKWDLF